MTQNGSITIDMYHDLKKLLKRNCQLRVDDLALVIDLPRENPWFDDPPKQQEEIHGELQMAQRTLHEFALPILDAIRGGIERSKINANNLEMKTTRIQMIQNTLQFKGNMMEDPN